GIERPARWTSGRLSAQDRQESLLDSDDVADALAHLLMIPSRRLVPGVEEHGVGPLRVVHDLAQKCQHRNTLGQCQAGLPAGSSGSLPRRVASLQTASTNVFISSWESGNPNTPNRTSTFSQDHAGSQWARRRTTSRWNSVSSRASKG